MQFEKYDAPEVIPQQIFVAGMVRIATPLVPHWKNVLMPPLSDAVDEMIQKGDLPIAIADAFDDLGQFLGRLASEIIAERQRRGMPLPDGPDDIAAG